MREKELKLRSLLLLFASFIQISHGSYYYTIVLAARRPSNSFNGGAGEYRYIHPLPVFTVPSLHESFKSLAPLLFLKSHA